MAPRNRFQGLYDEGVPIRRVSVDVEAGLEASNNIMKGSICLIPREGKVVRVAAFWKYELNFLRAPYELHANHSIQVRGRDR